MNQAPLQPAVLLPWSHPRTLYTHCVSTNLLDTLTNIHSRSYAHTSEHARTHTRASECPHTNEGISHGEALQRNHLVAWQQRSSAPTTRLLPIAVFVCFCVRLRVLSVLLTVHVHTVWLLSRFYVYTDVLPYFALTSVCVCLCLCVTVSDLRGK